MPCNVINNPSFEAGLSSWYSSTPGVATIGTGDIAYSGSSYLDLETTVSASEATISQDLYWLDDEKTHNLTVQVRLLDPISSADSCTVSAYLGDEYTADSDIASEIIWNAGEWISLTGTILPEQRDTVLNLVGACTFSGDVQTAHVLFDDVVFSDC
ncbi:hypothetical protein BDW59DRAFT_171134 [Aspergillus cavernicola]|uniref:CBM-cenC domain-containing protein n=1 Tax=Aspergillus cavernicola TaxID=176166 RepID=A0ABR4IJP8_9EURO